MRVLSRHDVEKSINALRMVFRYCFTLAVLLVGAAAASAVITALTPLSRYVADSNLILVAKVEKFFPEKPALVLTVEEDLKGKASFRRLPILVKLDAKAANENYIPPLLKRIAEGQEVVLFILERGKRATVFGFTEGSWFQILGQKVDEERREWSLVSGEPYLRRTFKGTTAELRQLILDGLNNKAKLPEPNEHEKPGFGPEIKKDSVKPTDERNESVRVRCGPKEDFGTEDPGRAERDVELAWNHLVSKVKSAPVGCGPKEDSGTENNCLVPKVPFGHARHAADSLRSSAGLFAVIPTIVVGAPLAILAALFPALFGGVFTLFRQWLAFITIISINSTILLFVLWLGPPFRGSWWGSEAGLWFVMTMITLVGVLWAWRRQIRNAFLPTGFPEAPRRTENCVLAFTSASCLIMVAITLVTGQPTLNDLTWDLTLAFSLGIWLATAIRLIQTFVNPDAISASRSTEGIILGVALFTSVCIYAARWGGQVNAEGIAEIGLGVTAAGDAPRPEAPTKRWAYGVPSSGVVLSRPLVHDDRVYVAVAHPTPKWGTLLCLERDTGKPLWEFTDDGNLQECYSSPVFADGKIYMGEGFHWSKNCRVYCIDAATGTKIWDFQTTSQTEATPAVVNGKVYIGACNQGYLCLDAKTGQKLWQFDASMIADAKKKILRFGGGPAIDGEKIYFGSGVDRDFPREQCDTSLSCVSADTGRLIWRQPVDLPCWGIPCIKGGLVYFSLGNGDVASDATDEPPAGAVIAVEAATGKQVWCFDVSKGIIEGPAVDHNNVYVGCRDGNVYCLGRFDGTERWRRPMGSPVISSPTLVRSPTCDQTASVLAVGANGRVTCLDPSTGEVQWSYDLTPQSPHIGPISIAVGHSPEGDRRRIFFGATLGGAGRLDGTPVIYCLEDLIKPR